MKREIMYWKYIFRLLGRVLIELLLFALAGWYLFMFILIWLSSDNTIWIGEPNVYIRAVETALLCFIIVWAARKIITKLQQARRHNGHSKGIGAN